MLREALAGRRIAITGATGFLGTALTERVLRCLPETDVVLVVRPGRRGANDRVERDVLRNDCFQRLRRELGDRFDAEAARRVTAVAGDVTLDGLGLDDAGRQILSSCSTVIHSAATVSFDAPLDAAVEVNLLGPARVATALRHHEGTDQTAPGRTTSGRTTAGRTAAGKARALPHLIAVSTAYVAGMRRGPAPEALLSETPFSARVPWRAEVEAARRARRDAEAASRDPKQLARLRAAARAELGAAGVPLLAERTEKLRVEWAEDRMVELGKARAQALGWPDAYAYSKALGEWALLEGRGALPVTVVRPSIIEAALSEPHPGWIRGFRMADPVIISYARGLLKEFPGIPEGIIDVIPVDLVVAAILAVAARGPLESPDVVHAASGARNPLRYGQLVNLVREWFSEHPLADDKGQPIEVPEWSFPGRRRVQNQLRQATEALRGAERALQTLPLARWRGRPRRPASRNAAKRPSEPSATSSCTAPTPRPRLCSRLTVSLSSRASCARTRNRSFASTPPCWSGPATATTSTCLRWWPTPGCAWPAPRRHASGPAGLTREERAAGRCSRPTASSPSSTWRTPSSPPTWSTPTLGSPPGVWTFPSVPASRCEPCSRRLGCSPWTWSTGATSCAGSTAATRTPTSASCAGTHASSPATCSWRSPSRPGSAASGSTVRSVTARCSSRGRSTSCIEPFRAVVRRRRLRPHGTTIDGELTGELRRGSSDRRGAGAHHGGLRRAARP